MEAPPPQPSPARAGEGAKRAWWGLLALLLVTPLAACNLHPVYGTNAAAKPAQAQLAQVQVELIQDRIGQQLRNLLIDGLTPGGYPPLPTYTLKVMLAEQRIDMGLRRDATATISEFRETAVWVLRDARTGAQLFDGVSRAYVRSNIVDSQFGTLLSADDARERAVHQLSDEIVTRLALYFDKRQPAAG